MNAPNIDHAPEALSNPVLACIEGRSSTRVFSDQPVTAEERAAILHAASRAPSAGAMMFYSIIEVADPAVRERLCHLCDDQPFMLKAGLWLLFVADNRKWLDRYERLSCYDDADLNADRPHGGYHAPGLGELLLACEDAMAAAQTAVIAGESLGVGSCYIGDVLEHGEQVAELLGLPAATMPLALLVMGHRKPRAAGETSESCTVDDIPADPSGAMAAAMARPAGQTPHPVVGLHMVDGYRLPGDEEALLALEELDEKFTPHAKAAGAPTGERARRLYRRKHTSDFMAEMNRSCLWWLKNWTEE